MAIEVLIQNLIEALNANTAALGGAAASVSYTHLTLPTKRIV